MKEGLSILALVALVLSCVAAVLGAIAEIVAKVVMAVVTAPAFWVTLLVAGLVAFIWWTQRNGWSNDHPEVQLYDALQEADAAFRHANEEMDRVYTEHAGPRLRRRFSDGIFR